MKASQKPLYYGFVIVVGIALMAFSFVLAYKFYETTQVGKTLFLRNSKLVSVKEKHDMTREFTVEYREAGELKRKSFTSNVKKPSVNDSLLIYVSRVDGSVRAFEEVGLARSFVEVSILLLFFLFCLIFPDSVIKGFNWDTHGS
ncbi:MAG: hypothetical protein SH819_09305 [Cytophagales bacterium]|nr:hypothetical protein [Cytophagales bacterium]